MTPPATARRGKRRLHRLLLPIGLVLALIIGTVLVRWLSEPDYAEAYYLSPNTSGETSGEPLAKLLRDKGITVQRETVTTHALSALWAQQGRATLFIPAPEFVHGDYLWMLRHSPPGTRVVLVEPGTFELSDAVPVLGLAHRRWATAVQHPGTRCAITDAGPAALGRSYFGLWSDALGIEATYCYQQSLALVDFQGVEFVVAGSPEPFRADRIAEHDNADLAVDLLSARPTLIWLDLHAEDSKPAPSEVLPGNGAPIPSLAPGDDRPRGGSPRPRPTNSAEPLDEPEFEAQEPPDPFPTWLLPLVIMLILIFLVLAFARGRRLGAPATEPLPIEVKGAETAIGRGNLYRRASARGAALETLRVEARRRLAVAIGQPAAADRDVLLAALAAHTGEPPDRFEALLYGSTTGTSEPENDDALQAGTVALMRLVAQITQPTRKPRQEGESHV